MGKSGSVSWVTVPFSCILVHTGFCLCPLRVFPQFCVSSGISMVGLMATSSKRAYALPRSAASRSPTPAAGHCWPVPPQETLKGRSDSVSVDSPGAHKILFEPSGSLWWAWGLSLNAILPLLLSCWVFFFALGCGVCFSFLVGSNILLSDGCSAVSCNFGVLSGEDEHTSFLSTISD